MKRDLIGIKGTKNGIVFIIAPELDLEGAVTAVTEKLTEAKGFFNAANYNIYAPHLKTDDILILEELFDKHGLIKNIEAKLPEIEKKPKALDEIAATTVKEIPEGDTLLLMRNIRSGQTIKYDGNIVVVGDVNPGAELIAAENIVVLGKLRGVAHAGYAGNSNTYILAHRLQPTQLRIYNHVSRAPENLNAVSYPEVARFSPEGIIIEKYLRNTKG